MSNLKRFLALTLVVVMVVAGAIPAFAAFKDVPETDVAATAIATLADLGIIKGTGADADGNPLFSPDAEVSRAQMAMFIARIRSAIPDFFKADASQPTKFADVKDPTYYSAINYCVNLAIINGRDEKTYDPAGTVTLQEAAKMMVTALGYTGIEYPVGTLTKARELKLLEGVVLDATRKLTRRDVATILYNYLVEGKYVDIVLAFNAVTGRNEQTDVGKYVIETFGIDRIEGYIVSAGGQFSMNYQVVNKAGAKVTLGAAAGYDLKHAATILDPRVWDMQVGFVKADGTIGANLFLEKAKLGLESFEDEYLIGLKILVYAFNEARTDLTKTIRLPSSKLIGTKKDVSKAVNTATTSTTSGDADKAGIAVNANNPAFNIDGIAYGDSLRPAGVDAAAYSYFYVWNGTRVLKGNETNIIGISNLNETAAGTINRSIAKFLKNEGAYTLHRIDNGTINNSTNTWNGRPEVTFIFEPYTIMQYRAHGNDASKDFLGNQKNETDNAGQKLDAGKIKQLDFNGAKVPFTKNNDAFYLIAIRTATVNADFLNNPVSGNNDVYVKVMEQLKQVAAGATNVYAADRTAVFQYADGTQHAHTFDWVSGSKAVGAEYYAYNNLLAPRFTQSNKYDLYANAAGKVIYVRQAAEAAYAPKDYAYVVEVMASITQWSGTSVNYVQPLKVIKYGSSTDEVIFINKVNKQAFDGSNSLIVGERDVIAYKLGLNNYYEISTLTKSAGALAGDIPVDNSGKALVNTDFKVLTDKGYYANYQSGVSTSSSTGFIDYSNDLLKVGTGADMVQGVINSNTKIIISNGAGKATTISATTLKSDKVLGNITANVEDALVVMDGRYTAGSVNYGPAVFVYIKMVAAKYDSAASDSSGISDSPYYVISDKRTSYGLSGIFNSNGTYYDTRVAYSLKDGSAIDVTSPNELAIGSIVKVTNNKLSGTFTFDDGTQTTYSAYLTSTPDALSGTNMSFTGIPSWLTGATVSDVNKAVLINYIKNASIVTAVDTYTALNVSRVAYVEFAGSIDIKLADAGTANTLGAAIKSADTVMTSFAPNLTTAKYIDKAAVEYNYARNSNLIGIDGKFVSGLTAGTSFNTYLVFETTTNATDKIAVSVTIARVTIKIV